MLLDILYNIMIGYLVIAGVLAPIFFILFCSCASDNDRLRSLLGTSENKLWHATSELKILKGQHVSTERECRTINEKFATLENNLVEQEKLANKISEDLDKLREQTIIPFIG